MIRLSARLSEEIRGHGERAYPDECCGLLLGRLEEGGVKEVSELFHVENAREAGERYHRSLITPEEYLRGERHARSLRLDVVGNYHSHPNHPAVPSQFDLEHAWPTWSYVIVSVREGRAEDLRSWELEPDRTRFREERVDTKEGR
ncbi:MAG TPA: M67 family metallopeptidase [Pyrinomonadaceae bacterium]|nr:M67 family metallopeptidase [Pyrinomonadaceae bacterium]